MDLQQIRKDFSILQKQAGGKPVIYFDSACQSLRPRPVVDAIMQYYQESDACGGRSNHRLATRVEQDVDAARQTVQKFLNAAKKEEIIFTRNTTEGLNLVAHSLNLQAGDVVLISDKEHNSNLIPWQMRVKDKGVVLKVLPSLPDNTFDLSGYESTLKGGVKLVSMGQTSNLDGVSIPAAEVVKLAHKHGALVMLDGAQSVPHQQVDVRKLDVDFLAFSGHKLLGPTGTGVLYGKLKLLDALSPFIVGGETVALSTYTDHTFLPVPEKFEAGLGNYAGIIGLGAAVKYLQQVGFDFIHRQELALNQAITSGLADVPGLHILGPADAKLRGGIVNFVIDGVDHHSVAVMLDQMANVEVRSGQHCVHSWFNAHHIKGSVRASCYFYNTLDEAAIFIDHLKKIRKVL